ncbi:hypothetical protein [Marinicella meishanensis]|uniref:hypothetical protein n=1 Tax=Marinicella meishanensis TaxID=2873263 RepID=UPI001CBFEBB3|nr:hypothetical protein [Marinicella sp. NBU2979]
MQTSRHLSSKQLITLILGLLLGLSASAEPGPKHKKTQGMGFPDFYWMVDPATYNQKYAKYLPNTQTPNPNYLPIFRLKTNYATEVPPKKNWPKFMKIDFQKEPLKYLEAARDYSFEGNIPAFGGGPIAWDPHGNKIREWVHLPWLHMPQDFPPNGGTEGFRGLITEINAVPYQFAAEQTNEHTIYAITLVNEYASYSLGRMWNDPNNPDPSAMDKRYGGGFIPGSVFAKLLLTDAPVTEVPQLQNPMQWQAYIQESFGSSTRKVGAVNLLQMDIAVRDPRSDDFTGWVFGTLVYNGAVNSKKSQFMNLVPLGLQWGNDPDIKDNKVNPFPPKPVKDIVNPDLKETVIFVDQPLPPQHLGWNSRLCGPADLSTVSCMGCHMAAQYPPVRTMFPPTANTADRPAGGQLPPLGGGGEIWMEWFQNTQCGVSMNPEVSYSTDFSFQVAIGLENFYTNQAQQLGGQWSTEYLLDKADIARGGMSGTQQ